MDKINTEIEERVSKMDEGQREHLRVLIYELVRCYNSEGKHCAIVILGNNDEGIENMLTMNCSTMEAANMLLAANDFLGYLNTKDAPPKEKFN